MTEKLLSLTALKMARQNISIWQHMVEEIVSFFVHKVQT